MKNFKYLLSVILLMPFALIAQDSSDTDVEEVVVVGSQIKGAKITGVLPVTIISAEDVDNLGIDSGDELLENMVEQGNNYFNEAEETSGGVNAARGDVGAYNLRNMGVGNTLVLLNGRRLVNNAGYQTELIGEDFLPTMTVNSQAVPVLNLDRVEVLRDGASAIYGADAVAGVVNNVLDTDFVGMEVKFRTSEFDNFNPGAGDRFNFKWGKDFNGGASNVTVTYDYYDRDRLPTSEDPKWSACNLKGSNYGSPDNMDFENNNNLRNCYTTAYIQLDRSGRDFFTDSSGETQILPLYGIDPMTELPVIGCDGGSNTIVTDYGTCFHPDTLSDGHGARLNPNLYRDARGKLERHNLFIFVNHEMKSGKEMYAEIGRYRSEYEKNKESGGIFSVQKQYMRNNYWAQQIEDKTGHDINRTWLVDSWRPHNVQRQVSNEKETYRFVLGFRGQTDSGWDWDTGLVVSKATMEDLTANRIGAHELYDGLNDSTPAAINPFAATNNNIERALVDVYRNDTSKLRMFDFKLSKPDVFSTKAGDVALLIGGEYRHEAYADDRDPLLDGTVPFANYQGLTHPFVSAVIGSSPSTDTFGERNVDSLFMEMQIPITDTINAQAAVRWEDIENVGSTTVGKFAVGWDVTNSVRVRGSVSTSTRAPNLIQIHQQEVTRVATREDFVYKYIGADDWDQTVQRYSKAKSVDDGLESETSTNTSFGVVIQPEAVDGLTITADLWAIEKEDTIGLFGRENHTVYDLALRLLAGNSDCSSFVGNPALTGLDEYDGSDDLELTDGSDVALDDAFAAAGICPRGQVNQVTDEYLNLATRTVEGMDIAIVYTLDTQYGDFTFKYNGSFTDEFSQEATSQFAAMQALADNGTIPENIPLQGFGDLLGKDGSLEEKHSYKIYYSAGDWGASLSGLTKGDFVQSKFGTVNGVGYTIPEMTTMDLAVWGKFDLSGKDARVKYTIKNFENERAPLADGYQGYFSDIHQDLGMIHQLELRVRF
ncbi:MAG: TonB-dependent receptor [SAR86 cluster bacterium]|uniref:TonB-dependent receptor n=1 Tax=SAR86 cluster bacterium TaxID=2030880 RepID=A0A520MY10_9GAMM|nr:MAG: TonB-dependent receptor [SAR86 cluster bacterium]